MKYLFSLSLMGLAIYSSFFEFSKYEGLFLAYSIISILMAFLGLISVSICEVKDLGDIGKGGLIGLYSKAAGMIWIVIWGKVIVNGSFWSGFAGLLATIISFMYTAIAADRRKKAVEGVK